MTTRPTRPPVHEREAFEWSDAWVFAALAAATDHSGHVVFAELIAAADMLNHAIVTADELKGGLIKLHTKGLVKIADARVTVTPLAVSLNQRVRRMRGGLFSIVDNALKVLNSPRTELLDVDGVPAVDFVTPSFVNQAYQEYVQSTRRDRKPNKVAPRDAKRRRA